MASGSILQSDEQQQRTHLSLPPSPVLNQLLPAWLRAELAGSAADRSLQPGCARIALLSHSLKVSARRKN